MSFDGIVNSLLNLINRGSVAAQQQIWKRAADKDAVIQEWVDRCQVAHPQGQVPPEAVRTALYGSGDYRKQLQEFDRLTPHNTGLWAKGQHACQDDITAAASRRDFKKAMHMVIFGQSKF